MKYRKAVLAGIALFSLIALLYFSVSSVHVSVAFPDSQHAASHAEAVGTIPTLILLGIVATILGLALWLIRRVF
jgi:hypothetical protein